MKPLIGQFLIAEGMISNEAVTRALGFQRRSMEPFRLGTILLDRDLLGLAVAHDPRFRRAEHREVVERPLGPDLLHDPDERVRHEDDAERRVLDLSHDQDHGEHRAEDCVEPREDVGADDLAVGAARPLARRVRESARDPLSNLGRGESGVGRDPLPEGAIARLGTLRFRGVRGSLVFAPGGKLLARSSSTARQRVSTSSAFAVGSWKIPRPIASLPLNASRTL